MSAISSHHAPKYEPARDSRKRKIPGLWVRNGRYYAQMRVCGKSSPVRIPLQATTIEAAKAALEELRVARRKNSIHLPGHRPNFTELVSEYCASADFAAKKKGTQENEEQALRRWCSHIGGVRVDWIKPSHIVSYRNLRRQDGVTARTINLDCIALNNVMRYAKSAGYITNTPRLPKLEERRPERRPLLSPDAVKTLINACRPSVTKNYEILRYFLQFLALTGAREQEALRMRIKDIDLDHMRLTIGGVADSTKNREHRVIQMTPELHTLLSDIISKLPPDTIWLFPSPRRGERDMHAKSLRASFGLVRESVGLEWVGFHDFRHFFISTCVMAGIDYMTIAEWVGHKDRGILIGRVYGHLSDEHKQRAAQRLRILT